MKELELKLSLPDRLASQAKAAGLLSPEYTEADLESELKAVRAELRARGVSA